MGVKGPSPGGIELVLKRTTRFTLGEQGRGTRETNTATGWGEMNGGVNVWGGGKQLGSLI